jgi:hypothetical protein
VKGKIMKKTIVSLVATLFVSSIMLIACSGGKESAALAAKWATLSAGVPKMVDALQSRVDILSQSKKLPTSITAEKFAEVKSALASAKDEWNKAQESFKAGKVNDAVAVGTSVKDKLVKAMEALGMAVPAGMKS